MWNRAGVCVLLLVAATSAKPPKEGHNTLDEPQDARPVFECYHNADNFPGLNEKDDCRDYSDDDILLPNREEQNRIIALNYVISEFGVWPSGIIPYTIVKEDYTPTEISTIEKSLSLLMDLTKVNGSNCIQIIPRTTEVDYVEIFGTGKGCWSSLGRQKGKQQLSLIAKICVYQGATIHEFLHALTFDHEQNRPDRDDYVKINWENIIPEKCHNFKKRRPKEVNLLGAPYDYLSIMHYGIHDFAINASLPTIIPRDPKVTTLIGGKQTPSPMDIERIQILYKCIRPVDSKFFKDFDEKLIPEPIL